VSDRLAQDPANFWARIAEPPVARAYVVLSAAAEDQAAFIAQYVSLRHARRVIAELGAVELSDQVSVTAHAHRFDSYAVSPG
jgi:hypothetical protein